MMAAPGSTAENAPCEEPSGEPHDYRLSLRHRLRKSARFRQAFERSRPYAGRFMVLRVTEAPDASLKLGVVAGKRTFRRAVDRARAKRMLREAFRLLRHRFSGPYDVVLVARHLIRTATLAEAQDDLMELARRAGLLQGTQRRVPTPNSPSGECDE